MAEMTGGYHVLPDGHRLFWRVDDFTDPWKKAPTVLLIHGFAETGEAWRPWVPHLGRDYRVLRIDRRGFGRSDPMPTDFAWSLDLMVDDTVSFIEAQAAEGTHIVAAKIATPLSIRLAARRPDLVKSLVLCGGPATAPNGESWARHIEERGARDWAASTMDARMGPEMPAVAKAWWTDFMGATPTSTMTGFMRNLAKIDVSADVGAIQCPTLVVATDSAYRPLSQVTPWQSRIPRSRLAVIAGGGFHPAAVAPDLCAETARAFLREVDQGTWRP
jgi:pimeloyl-ACP methyl ester carboxylesterase